MKNFSFIIMDNLKFKKLSSAAYFFIVAGLTFAAGIGLLKISPQISPVSDDIEYYALASNIAQGNGFSIDGQNPSIYRPPLFSTLLGGWFYLTQNNSLFSGSMFQAIIHALGAGMAFFLFFHIFKSTHISLFLALWLGLMPPHISRIMLLMQEPLIALLTTFSILLTLKFIEIVFKGII